MNKLKKLSLHKLEEEVLADQTMRCLKGGGAVPADAIMQEVAALQQE